MKTTSRSRPLIKDALAIRSRYVRAVNISRDLDDTHALDGYLLTETVRGALGRLSRGLLASSTQRAWRITGSYGSGKSAFGLFLASLFSQPIGKRSVSGKLLSEYDPELLPKLKKLPRYEVVVITGTRSDASIALVKALAQTVSLRRASVAQKQILTRLSAFITARKTRQVSAHEAVSLLTDVGAYLAAGVNGSEGLLLIVDEFGRWLEHATDPDADIDASFFQLLAEACGGKAKGSLISVVAILHQRFEDHVSGRRDRRSGVEWAKVAERFEDITFSQSFESTTHMIERALEPDAASYRRAGIAAHANKVYAQASALGVLDASRVGIGRSGASSLYPFHPIALAAANSMFRRFGQNERSTFSFLLSSEPFALQDFMARNALDPATWYRVHNLCDWLLSQGTLRTLDEERVKRWALLQEVLRAAPVFEELEIRCLKTVGLLNLLEPQPGLAVTQETVALAIADDPGDRAVGDTLDKLIKKCLLYVRPSTQELCLWPQSSVDVASELARIRRITPALSRLGALIEQLPPARPIVAHRHYLETGTLRLAQVELVDDLGVIVKRSGQPRSADGLVLIVPCYPDQDARSMSDQLAQLSATLPTGVVVALRRIGEEELDVAEELLAWQHFERECVELRVDTYARTEVRQAIHRLTSMLVHRLADLRVPSHGGQAADWWHAGQLLAIQDGRSLNRSVSEVFDALFAGAPVVRNELINRSAISSAAAAARQKLLERMFSHSDVEDLGIEMTPPEKAIYLSVLKDSGLHRKTDDGWAFCAPAKKSGWHPAWMELHRLLGQDGALSLQSIVTHFAAPPFGMRESTVLLMITAFLRVHRQELVIRERGTYVAQLESSHIARLVKRPESFELHMVNSQAATTAAFDVVRDVLSEHLGVTHLSPTVAELTRSLYQWYLSLPEYTLNTIRLDHTHRAALALLGKAGDPVELLTVGLPLALGITKKGERSPAATKESLAQLRAKLGSLLKAASKCLDDLRLDLLNVIAEEVGVRDVAAVRGHLIALAKESHEELLDYSLVAFIQRTCDGKRNHMQWIDSLASLLGGRSIESWQDDTTIRFRAEVRRVHSLLTRVVALAKLSGKRKGADHTMVAVHVVDHKGNERFVSIPADSKGTLPLDRMAELRDVLDRIPVPAYVLASLLLEYSMELPDVPTENAA
jgi:hypothetical protein